MVTIFGITFGPVVAENNAPQGQNSAENFVNGVPGQKQPCVNLLLLLLLFFIIILY